MIFEALLIIEKIKLQENKRNENSNICNWMKTKAKIISIGLSHVYRISMAQNNSLYEETDIKPVNIP